MTITNKPIKKKAEILRKLPKCDTESANVVWKMAWINLLRGRVAKNLQLVKKRSIC